MADSGELRKRTFVVTRFDPDVDQAPKTQSYEVPCRPEWKVLDALNYIKDEIDPTLSHRWSCRSPSKSRLSRTSRSSVIL